MSRPDLPAMLYKLGTALEWDGELFDTLTVETDHELDAALKAGWSTGKPSKAAKASEAPKSEPAEPKAADRFDHDGDGKPGGSLPKAERKKKAT